MPTGLVLELKECLYVPSITKNVISISCLVMDGFTFEIGNKGISFFQNEMFYGSAEMFNGIYVLNLHSPNLNIESKRLKSNNSKDSYLWHCRLGHINERRLTRLHKDGYLGSFDWESIEQCESCLCDKMTKSPFTGKGERTSECLGLIHTDVCGPINIQAIGSFSYFITFIDDHSRYGHMFLMKHKFEAFEKFKEFRSEVKKQSGKSIKIL